MPQGPSPTYGTLATVVRLVDRPLAPMKPSEPTTPVAAHTVPATDAHPPNRPLAGSAAVIGLATMTSRILGLGRNLVLASLFGASNAMDAYVVAFRIPNLMRDLFAEGVMSAAFVPTFTQRLTTEGRDAAWRLGTQLINALVIVTGVLVLTAVIFAEPLIRLFARDFADVPGKLELTVNLTRVMLPFLTLVAVAAACMGMLNSLRRFFIPALSPAMMNVSVILSGVLLVPLMPGAGLERIMAIAFGVVLGGVGQIAIQYWALRKEGFRYRFMLDPADPGLRKVLGLMGPGTVAGAALQINQVVTTILATSQGIGAVSWLTYAFQIMYLPIGVLGVSIATAAIPALSRQAALGQSLEMRRTISHSLRLMLMLMVPATVGLIVLAVPIVRLLFERGAFTPADTQATALALTYYVPGMLGYSVVRLAVPSFYALGTSGTPAVVSGGTVALNIVLNLVLVRVMGYQGLALGNAIAALSNGALLLVLLRRRLDGLDGARIADSFARISVAAVVMGAAVWQANLWFTALWTDTGLWTQLLIVGSDLGVGLAVLGAVARLLGLAEFTQVMQQILARLTRAR